MFGNYCRRTPVLHSVTRKFRKWRFLVRHIANTTLKTSHNKLSSSISCIHLKGTQPFKTCAFNPPLGTNALYIILWKTLTTILTPLVLNCNLLVSFTGCLALLCGARDPKQSEGGPPSTSVNLPLSGLSNAS